MRSVRGGFMSIEFLKGIESDYEELILLIMYLVIQEEKLIFQVFCQSYIKENTILWRIIIL